MTVSTARQTILISRAAGASQIHGRVVHRPSIHSVYINTKGDVMVVQGTQLQGAKLWAFCSSVTAVEQLAGECSNV